MSFIQPREFGLKWILLAIIISAILGSVIGSWITLLVRMAG